MNFCLPQALAAALLYYMKESMLRNTIAVSLLAAVLVQPVLAAQPAAGEGGSTTAISDLIRHHNDNAQKASLVGEVRRLIAQGADVNAAAGGGRTALMQAMFQADENVIALLLATGANVHVRDHRGASALALAACSLRLFDPDELLC